MATLNTREKLIRNAATGNSPTLYSVYKVFYTHFEAECSVGKKLYDDCMYINYLYCQNHRDKTYENIAGEIFHISVSTLESRRKQYIGIFDFYLKKAQAESEAAPTKP